MCKLINFLTVAGFVLTGLAVTDCANNQDCRVVDESSEIARRHSAVFSISDENRPGAWCWFQDSTMVRGAAMRRGWVCDAEADPDGNPPGIFQMRANNDPYDHRYFFARYHIDKWHVNHMAYAGGYFGGLDQPDYTGLASVDPLNPDVVFISADVDPVSGEPLFSAATGKPRFEIFMGRTRNPGNISFV